MLTHCAVVRLVEDINHLSHEIRTLKDLLRQTWTRPMNTEQQALVRLKQHVTDLCVVRAALRGRYHVLKPLRAGSYPGMKWDKDTYRDLVVERIVPQYQPTEKAG